MRTLLTVMMLAGVCRAEKLPTQQLIEMARIGAAGLEQALRDTLGSDNIEKGTAAVGEMGEFVWAMAAEKVPSLQINDEAPSPLLNPGRCG